jgi:hypothetical protein
MAKTISNRNAAIPTFLNINFNTWVVFFIRACCVRQVVHALAARLLAAGQPYVGIVTDAANPTRCALPC